MALILFHSPKGGVGTSFLAAHVAMALAEGGLEVSALDFTYQASLKQFFGLLPGQPVVEAGDPRHEPQMFSGVELYDAHELGRSAAFAELLRDPDERPFAGERIFVADVASGNRELRQLLYAHADMQICTIEPRPIALSALTKVDPDVPLADLDRAWLVLNGVDDTVTFSRHDRIFLKSVFNDKLLGIVRADEAVAEALGSVEPLASAFPRSVALADIQLLAERVMAVLRGSETESAQADGAGSDDAGRYGE